MTSPLTTAPTNEMLALADEYAAKAKLKWPDPSDVRKYVLIENALRLAATPSARDVRVKLLEWSQNPPPAHEHEPFVYYAAGIGGHYRAERNGMLWMAHDAFVWEQHPTQKAAQAAAQADYEKRMLSNLDAAAPAAGGDEVSVELMQRIWLNLYYNEEEAGGTFQRTLNEVVDWLARRNSLPTSAPPLQAPAFDLPKRPFAFAVRRAPENGPDQWRLFMDEGEARAEAEQLDGDYEALFRVGDRRSAIAALQAPAHSDADAKTIELAKGRLSAMRIAPPTGLESSRKAAEEIEAAFSILEKRSAITAPAAKAPASWTVPTETVADLISDLRTVDPALKVYGAYHIDTTNDRCRARDVSMSLERVSGNRIRTGDESVPYSLVIWTQPDFAPAVSEADVGRNFIEAERARQISEEGWDASHDDAHDNGELLRAAMCYLCEARLQFNTMRPDGSPLSWPWETRWWKPSTPERNFVKGGALLLAERDRLDRAGRPHSHVDHKIELAVKWLNELIQSAAQGGGTESDGGVEGNADPSCGRSSRASHLSRELEEAGIKPGPSDDQGCEHCGDHFPIETMTMMEDHWICPTCYTKWKEAFDACEHSWEPYTSHSSGDEGRYCSKCCCFEANPSDPPSQEASAPDTKRPNFLDREAVKRAICKSRTCEGIRCCQWPCNGGRWHDSRQQPGPCRVEEGRYDDAANEVFALINEGGEG